MTQDVRRGNGLLRHIAVCFFAAQVYSAHSAGCGADTCWLRNSTTCSECEECLWLWNETDFRSSCSAVSTMCSVCQDLSVRVCEDLCHDHCHVANTVCRSVETLPRRSEGAKRQSNMKVWLICGGVGVAVIIIASAVTCVLVVQASPSKPNKDAPVTNLTRLDASSTQTAPREKGKSIVDKPGLTIAVGSLSTTIAVGSLSSTNAVKGGVTPDRELSFHPTLLNVILDAR
eukprot:TRINITY_DN25239_c0_g1_i1.p1 TRINITY_DN25239_c0_g1~~TRINITY_DN25239_c0_g1_i1.p1  ORF type:complete len:230 (+),score=10.46 TRINITY_DN25239_c0_g1_i1:87-776(+)